MEKKIIFIYVGVLCGSLYIQSSENFTLDFNIDDRSLDGLIDALSNNTAERSYSSGNSYKKMRIDDGVDLAKYIYNTRKSLLENSNITDKKEQKKTFLEGLRQYVEDEYNPEETQTHQLVYEDYLLSIRPKALVDILVQIDTRNNIKRPEGELYYTKFQEVLRYTKKRSPQMYTDCAREVMKNMLGKHFQVARELRKKEETPRIADVIAPLSSRFGSVDSSAIVDSFDLSHAFNLMKDVVKGDTQEIQGQKNQLTTLANMFGSLVSGQKEQQQSILFSQLQQQLEAWRTVPQEKINETHYATQKVKQGTDANLKATIIANVVGVILLAVSNYFTTGSIGGSCTNTTV